MDDKNHSKSFPDPNVLDIDSEGLMVPPWIKFPNIPLGSIGWRMGVGEDYWYRFRNWYHKQIQETQKILCIKYPEPDGWTHFYQRLK
jgi:hypothetical protein